MARRATSDNAIVSARPTFVVDGQDLPELSNDLIWLDVHQTDDGMSSLEAQFVNWRAEESGQRPDFAHFEGELDFGAELVVRAGDSDNEAVIFEGLVTALEGVFGEQMPPEIVVCAEDELQKLRMTSRSEAREDVTDADIVDEVGRAHGLSVSTDARGSRQRAHLQINRSDLAVARERARAADARLGVSDGELTLVERQKPAGEAIELTWFDDLLEFQVSADLAHQRRRVEVHGYSPADKEGVHGSAGPGDVERTAEAGRTGPQILDDLDLEADAHHHADNPETDGEADRLARALQMARARRFVQGRGVTSGTPSLRVGDVVDLEGLGLLFSGKYNTVEVRHTFDLDAGLRTRFEARRVTVGDTR